MSTLRYDDIIETIRVDEVLDALGVRVEKIRNGNHWGDCPLHDDRGGHFSIDEDTLVWNCFHCGGGVLPQLIMQVFDFDDWAEAIEWLVPYSDGEQGNLEDDEWLAALQRNLAKEPKHTYSRRFDFPVFNERILDRLQEVPLELVEKWHIENQDTLRTYRIGYDPEWSRGSYVGPALIIPHFFQGKLVGYQERWLGDDRPLYIKKYMNTDDFPKEETLFGWDRREILSPLIVVESVMSVVRLYDSGFSAVATFGSISKQQQKLLRTQEAGVILSFDNDKPGRRNLDKAVKALYGEIPVTILPFIEEEKGDIADLDEEELIALLNRGFRPDPTT